jgi:hypothetical protein
LPAILPRHPSRMGALFLETHVINKPARVLPMVRVRQGNVPQSAGVVARGARSAQSGL